MEIDYKAIGKRIKIARINIDATQESIAEKVGVTASHMSNIETANTKVSLPTLIAIANALSVSVDDLLYDNVLFSKVTFKKQATEIFDDCNDYEMRVLTKSLKATKSAIREYEELKKRIKAIKK